MRKLAILTLMVAALLATFANSEASGAVAANGAPGRGDLVREAANGQHRQPAPTATPLMEPFGGDNQQSSGVRSDGVWSDGVWSDGDPVDHLPMATVPGSDSPLPKPALPASGALQPLDTLHIMAVNDDFDQALEIAALPFVHNSNTGDATSAADDPELCAGSGSQRGATVWFRLVAPSSQPLLVSTHGSNYDTMVAVFTGERGNLTMLACNDDSFDGVNWTLQSQVQPTLEAGVTYYIEVADFRVGGVGGDLVLSAELIPFTSCADVVGVSQTECEALVALYSSTSGPSWLNRTGWLESNRPCTWFGVACDVNGLSGLSLNDNQLSGALPAQLGNLSNLQILRLNTNALVGALPTELGNLTNLRSLYLYRNQLSGSIPAWLGNLANLEILELGGNQLSGSIPVELGGLANLRVLYLPVNNLTGSIPPELGNLAALQYLGLHNNQLSGEIPASLGNLGNLLHLSLGANQLTGAIPASLGDLGNLQYLSVGANQLTGVIPEQLGALSQLRELYLYTNQLSGEIPASLGNLGNLLHLSLGANQLNGAIPDQLGALSQLRELYLYTNQLSGEIPASLGNLGNLLYLHLGANQLSGAIPEQLGALSQLVNLYLDNNQLSGEIPASLGNLGNLQVLRLSANQLSGAIPASLGDLGNLQYLSVGANQLSGAIPEQLGALSQLVNLYLYTNQLGGSIPTSLGNLSALQVLHVNGNPLKGSLPDSLAALSGLQSFYFYDTQLCIPDTPSIQNWLALIPTVAGTEYICSELTPGALLTKLTNGYSVDNGPGPYLNVGEAVTWTYVLTNTGGVPLVDLTLFDDIEGAVTECTPLPSGESLLPGESITCTLSGSAIGGHYTNTAIFTGAPAIIFTDTVVVSATGHYVGALPEIVLVKLTNGEAAHQEPGRYLRVGDTVEWTYHVTNTGNTPLVGLVLTDDPEGDITECTPALSEPLAPGATLTCTHEGVVRAGQYTNLATVGGTTPTTEPLPVSATDHSVYYGLRAQLMVDKTTQGQEPTAPPGPVILSGAPVAWSYIVRNSGELVAYNVTLADDREGMISQCSPIALPASLQPGAVTVCAKTGVAQVGQYANTATVSGVVIPPDNNVWQLLGSDTSYYLGRGGEVQFTKTTNGQNASRTPGIFLGIGEPVTWSYHITNTGHVALSSVRIVDDREGDILNCTPSLELVLAPGASVSCTKSGITQRGQYTNTATFVGASVSGPAHVVQASATNYYFASSSEMAKSIAPAMANAGDELTVTLVVTSHVPARSTTFHLVDQLPREFQLVDGSIVASIGSAAVDAATNAIRWSHTSAAGVSARLTLTYRVRLTTACFAEVNSVAELFDASDPSPVGRVGATVRPANGSYCELFLPMTIAQEPPPDPMPSLINGFFDAWPLGEGWTQLINGMPERLLYNRTETQPVDAMTAPNLAWLGGRPNQTNQLRQQQRILIPSQYETKLQFGYYIASRESRCGNDWAEIRVGATAVPTPADLLLRIDLCSAANTNAWRNHPPISLNAFRGRSVTIEFFTSLNGSDNSNLYLDNLEICSDQQAPFCRYSLRSVLLDEDETTSSDLIDHNPIPLNRADAYSPKPE